jgi:cell division protein ZapE
LRRLFDKGSAGADRHCANARVIHDYFHHKAGSQGYTLSHSQQRVIDCMAQHASTLLGTSGKALPGLYLHGAVGRGKS